jgi:hypothetical protein
MAKKPQKKRPRPRKRRRRAPSPRRLPSGPTLVTPEGDPLVFVRARYRLCDRPGDERSPMDEIARLLDRAEDFGVGNEVDAEPDEETLQFPWYETAPGAKPPQDSMDRRVLAMVTLTPNELEIETMSQQRMARCRRRLEDLLGALIHHAETTTKTVAQVLAEPPPTDAPEPAVLPPEAIAEIEDRMLRQWLDESIPALDGRTPREAARTPEGRQMLEDLFEYIERQQARMRQAPGMFSPDYRKAKTMLGLE